MRATIVYIYLCGCIGIFECEAHFNRIIVPASVWGYEVMGGFTCFTVRRVSGGTGQVTGVTLGVLQSPWAVCSLNAGQSVKLGWGVI